MATEFVEAYATFVYYEAGASMTLGHIGTCLPYHAALRHRRCHFCYNPCLTSYSRWIL